MSELDQRDRSILKDSWTYFRKMNRDIASGWCRCYIASIIWSNISTPLNLTFVLMSACTTGQAVSHSLLSERSSLSIAITMLILSTLNTFFTPEKRYNQCAETNKMWTRFGLQLEELHLATPHTTEERVLHLHKLKELFTKVNELKRQQTFSCLTDFVYSLWRCRSDRLRKLWIPAQFLPPYKQDEFEGALKIEHVSLENYINTAVWNEPEFKMSEPELTLTVCTQTPDTFVIPNIIDQIKNRV